MYHVVPGWLRNGVVMSEGRNLEREEKEMMVQRWIGVRKTETKRIPYIL
jgi:hypothetical protein